MKNTGRTHILTGLHLEIHIVVWYPWSTQVYWSSLGIPKKSAPSQVCIFELYSIESALSTCFARRQECKESLHCQFIQRWSRVNQNMLVDWLGVILTWIGSGSGSDAKCKYSLHSGIRAKHVGSAATTSWDGFHMSLCHKDFFQVFSFPFLRRVPECIGFDGFDAQRW